MPPLSSQILYHKCGGVMDISPIDLKWKFLIKFAINIIRKKSHLCFIIWILCLIHQVV